MLDRNLGATSANVGEVGALGLLYQWGRKDPFLASSSTTENVVAASTYDWPAAVPSDASNGTIEYATKNPTTFIQSNTNNSDWYYSEDNNTDNERWASTKTIYDPCPAGYRLPEGYNESIWYNAFNSTPGYSETGGLVNDDNLAFSAKENKGIDFASNDVVYKLMSSGTCWYPAAGYIKGEDGKLADNANRGDYWTCTPIQGNLAEFMPWIAGRFRIVESGNTDLTGGGSRAYGQSVRCQKITE